MKQFLGLIIAIGLVNIACSQNFVPVDSLSEVKFKIKNFGVNIGGQFTGLQGKIQFDPSNLAGSKFEASVDVNTVNTGIDMRDDHLRNQEYFDVKNHPKIVFVSTKITTSTKADYLYIFGNLTIKNITKEISFPFKSSVQGNDIVFTGEFKLNRRDFEIGGSSITLSDNLTVTLSVFAKKE